MKYIRKQKVLNDDYKVMHLLFTVHELSSMTATNYYYYYYLETHNKAAKIETVTSSRLLLHLSNKNGPILICPEIKFKYVYKTESVVESTYVDAFFILAVCTCVMTVINVLPNACEYLNF